MQTNWIKHKGVIKAQSGTKSPYQLIMQESPSTYTDGYGIERDEYEPKWIKVARNIRQRLSPTLNNNGERKYVGSSGMLGFLVAPEWEGLEIPEVTSMHRGFQGTPKGISAVETSRFVNIPKQAVEAPKSVVKGNSTAASKKPSKAMLQAFKEKTGFDFSVAPTEMQEREIAAWDKYVANLRARYRKNR